MSAMLSKAGKILNQSARGLKLDILILWERSVLGSPLSLTNGREIFKEVIGNDRDYENDHRMNNIQ